MTCLFSCLRALGEDGVFCVRDGLEGRQTLDVYHQGSIVKYKIVNKENVSTNCKECKKNIFLYLKRGFYYGFPAEKGGLLKFENQETSAFS